MWISFVQADLHLKMQELKRLKLFIRNHKRNILKRILRVCRMKCWIIFDKSRNKPLSHFSHNLGILAYRVQDIESDGVDHVLDDDSEDAVGSLLRACRHVQRRHRRAICYVRRILQTKLFKADLHFNNPSKLVL